jgi:thiosulfate/3-mercaptopyruvate sulfurtransferase
MATDSNGYANAHLLVYPQELAELLRGEQPPLVIDLRAAHAYAGGHLPGAVHLDVWGVSLIDTEPAPLRAFLWMIEHLLATRGVSNDRTVVLYEEDSGVRVARAFWFLEYFGHPDVRVLDGGMRAWRAAGFAPTTEASAPVETTWSGARHDEKLATWKDVHARLGREDVAILDTRSDGEYCGTVVRAARGGAIPGAIHVEWSRNLTQDGRFKPAADLRAMYEAAGVTPDREVVAYCQGGYRAAHSYLALRLLGYPRVRNYLGSWREWGDRTELPIAKG